MTECKRNMTREQMIEGLKSGKTLNVDRCDAPELPELWELEKQGLVTSKLKEIDEQSSVLKFRWINCPACGVNPLPEDRVQASLSRFARGVYLCTACGMKEAVNGYFWKNLQATP